MCALALCSVPCDGIASQANLSVKQLTAGLSRSFYAPLIGASHVEGLWWMATFNGDASVRSAFTLLVCSGQQPFGLAFYLLTFLWLGHPKAASIPPPLAISFVCYFLETCGDQA